MHRRRLLGFVVLSGLFLGRTAAAQPETDLPPPPGTPAHSDEAPQSPAATTDPVDLPVKQKSYFVPAAEILILNFGLVAGAGLAGMPWADSNVDSAKRNVTTLWEVDDDAYTTNQLGHPFGGALLFSTARSTGHNWWVSGAYAFAGSWIWEALLENEVASLNDQITTPVGGMFIGEAMHRFGRALMYPGYGKPTLLRKVGAAILDPIGSVNRSWWGDAWAKTVPPALNAYFGVGIQQPTDLVGNRSGDAQFHVEAFVEHGLAGDQAFDPKRAMDHFELHTAVNAHPDNIEGQLYVRGLLAGTGFYRDGFRSMGGLYGAYDFNNNDYVRASMLGIGPGGTAELGFGNRHYIAATLAAYLVPYGSAGGMNELENIGMRDNHSGPGLAQLAELKLGQRGLYTLKLSSRAYEIGGRVAGDVADEFVIATTAGARVNFTAHHAIGAESTYSYRRANFADETMNTDPDRTMDFRLFYAITTDEILGR